MLTCPHCAKEIEVKALERVPWWNKSIGGPSVSLGKGNFIIIAIIVYIFSGGVNISGDVSLLVRMVDELTVLVEEIHASTPETP